MSKDNPIYPKYYYSRGGVNDFDWIMIRLAHIPEELKQEVCDKYEKLFLSSKDGRKQANTYLQGIAKEYRLMAQRKAA